MQDEASMQEHLFEYFNSEGYIGFLGNVSITLTDKADGKDSKKRDWGGRWSPRTFLLKILYEDLNKNIETPM